MRGSEQVDPRHSTVDLLPDTTRRFMLGAALAAPFLSLARPAFAAAPEPRPYSARVVQSGHSLTDPIVPVLAAMVAAVGGQEAKRGVIEGSTIPGSPMDWRWDNRTEYPPDARTEIGNYDVLVITERAPLSTGTLDYHKSDRVALKWFEHAWSKGNGGRGAETVLYASWVEVTSGPDFENPWGDPEGNMTFRDRMGPEMERWQTIADYVNANRPEGSPPMPVIPGPMIMAAVHDAIAAGTAPGLRAMTDLFFDDIHINDVGAYLITLAHFAVIYRRDPRIIPSRLGSVPTPPQATADWMKELVATVLKGYPSAGLDGVL